MWIEELRLGKKIKQFELIAFCLLYDHFHMMVRPNEKENLSEIMRSFKTNFSRNANRILGISESEQIKIPQKLRSRDLNFGKDLGNMIKKHNNKLKNLKTKFLQKYKSLYKFPIFQWQKSFYDHFIRNDLDYDNHWQYTTYNYLIPLRLQKL